MRTLLLMALIPVPHGLLLKVQADAQGVRLEAFFDDDTPAERAKVRLEQNGKLLAEGVTDAKGLWSHAALPSGEYLIIVDAGAGHRAEKRLTVGSAAPPIATPAPQPTREEMTRFPYGKVAIGLVVIAWAAVILWLFSRKSGPSAKPAP